MFKFNGGRRSCILGIDWKGLSVKLFLDKSLTSLCLVTFPYSQFYSQFCRSEIWTRCCKDSSFLLHEFWSLAAEWLIAGWMTWLGSCVWSPMPTISWIPRFFFTGSLCIGCLGFLATRCQSICLLMWWLASPWKKVELLSLLKFGQELTQHHFGHILLVKTSHRSSLDLTLGETVANIPVTISAQLSTLKCNS